MSALATPAYIPFARTSKFRIGDVWESRNPQTLLGPDHWRIVAISDHPRCPVIAQHECGSTREFSLNGIYGGEFAGEESERTSLDLVRLVRGAL